jgi:fatty-acyl-CoA synthase
MGDLRSASGALSTVIETADEEFGQSSSHLAVGQIGLADLLGDLREAEHATFSWTVDDEDPVLSINYTSGTRGKPKGVMYSHRGAYLNSPGEVIHNRLDNSSIYLCSGCLPRSRHDQPE